MLQFLNISNIALIDELQVEFEPGLNLLTGETGSGKSIIVDALGVLIGGRFTSDLLKSGTERGSIEGLFIVRPNPGLERLLDNAGLPASEELIIRRELSATGRNKIFINNQLATNSLLRELREFLVDIHGQGDQQTLFNPRTHLELLDSFAVSNALLDEVTAAYHSWTKVQRELDAVQRDDAEKFQLLDTLKFQIDELERAQLVIGEDERLEEERRRLANVEKLTQLSQSSYARIYEEDDAALARVRQTLKDVTELAEYESSFGEYLEGLENTRAVLEDLSFSLREFSDKLEFSPARLGEIEDRLAELSRLKRKYGGSIQSALEHLARSQDRLRQIETSDEREQELVAELNSAHTRYLDRAAKLHRERVRAAKRFEKSVEKCIAELAMEHGRFQIKVDNAIDAAGPRGTDNIEFYFSANAGEDLKPLARVASGGEASRLMLVLKTVANATEFPRTIVFDEIDSGIGGRVSEAVGIKLRKLAQTNQVLCVTHQPQIARFADSHLAVQKAVSQGRTQVDISKLNRSGRIEELARMLTGAEITDAARRHARELLKFS
ncbi:MAG TPA: DNA repair protein RecN [Pyrinomonadaceae bacterium]|nr:DNA repair protein RecN [Pyrinomonadaceae bacterium]